MTSSYDFLYTSTLPGLIPEHWGPVTRDSLAGLVRESEHFAFEDGETIADCGSHSDAELWSDVIGPAIEAGLIVRVPLAPCSNCGGDPLTSPPCMGVDA